MFSQSYLPNHGRFHLQEHCELSIPLWFMCVNYMLLCANKVLDGFSIVNCHSFFPLSFYHIFHWFPCTAPLVSLIFLIFCFFAKILRFTKRLYIKVSGFCEMSEITVLKGHIRVKHKGIWYKCIQCFYKRTWKMCLQLHKDTKHDSRKYECNQCDFQANLLRSLNIHIKKKTSMNKIY